MLINRNDSLLLLIDLQASLMPKVINSEKIVTVTNKLVSVARELAVPIVVTEHYPEGLKPTIPEVAGHLGDDYKPLVKREFSCFGNQGFRQALDARTQRTLVMTGIETHICILQTALQAAQVGFTVFVAVDGVGSRAQFDHDMAIERMRSSGIQFVTWEMVTYEWMRRADTPDFKRVLPHIKEGIRERISDV